ncbi:MAG TPA: protein kinase [Pyrinomonadaceae bacterium]|nr:protein kinase [Pyrinomonadaceae bacterium]
MLPERWQQVKFVLETALEIPVAGREGYLDETCGNDSDLRAEIDSYLSVADEKDDLFENGAVKNAFWREIFKSKNTYFGRQIGKYKITDEIGAGGMGRVFLARRADGEFEQAAAVKFLRQGLDTPDAVRRFSLERQILAKLEHPNIARLIDGGTTEDDVPYLIMEYIEGVPIDRYCRKNELSLESRLDLFKTVCAAVAYAHRNLIVHRDLKPDNILVGGDGAVKLLDFGIAKLISDEADKATVTRWQILTPEYASPEQIRGESITTASDVYALGVILYELLTDARPFRFESGKPEEMLRVISHTAPRKPSDTRAEPKREKGRAGEKGKNLNVSASPRPLVSSSQLKGDLDNIILKSLKKEPERRYSTVEQFSEDISRYLRGLPVSARRDTWAYRAEKYVKRNFAAVTAAFLVFLSLVGGTAVANYQAAIARREREHAERRFDDVRRLANSVLFEFYDALNETPGSTPIRRMMVERALGYLDKLAGEAQDDVPLQRELATAYLKIGDVQGKPNMANTGDTAKALESYGKAAAILEKLVAADSQNAENRRDLSTALANIGRIQSVSKDYMSALDTYRRVLEMRETLAADNPNNIEYRRLIADSRRLIGDALGEIYAMTEKTDLLDERLANYRQALEIEEGAAKLESPGGLQKRIIAILYQRIGSGSSDIGDATQNAEHFQAALENHQQSLGLWLESEPTDVNGRFPAGEYKHIGSAQLNLGDTGEALENFDRARIIFENLIAGDPESAEYRRELANLQIPTAKALTKAGRPAEAIKSYRKAIEIFEKLSASDSPRVTDNYRILTAAYQSLGELLENQGEKVEAAEIYRKAAESGAKWLEIAPDNNALKARQSKVLLKLARSGENGKNLN